MELAFRPTPLANSWDCTKLHRQSLGCFVIKPRYLRLTADDAQPQSLSNSMIASCVLSSLSTPSHQTLVAWAVVSMSHIERLPSVFIVVLMWIHFSELVVGPILARASWLPWCVSCLSYENGRRSRSGRICCRRNRTESLAAPRCHRRFEGWIAPTQTAISIPTPTRTFRRFDPESTRNLSKGWFVGKSPSNTSTTK